VIFLDLDDFKLINDTRGHDVGDLLLVALTPKLASALRPGDTIARFGGDEFVVLCEDLTGEADAIGIATRIAEASSAPVMVGGVEHTITVSAGVALVGDPASASPAGLLRDADAAMYRAKAGGHGRVAMFDEGMRARLIERVAIESSLRKALDRDELRVFYQPVMSLRHNRIVSVEALLRWQHPHRGLLEPGDFIAVAESSGLIVRIGEWVMEQACRQAVAWRAAAPDAEPIHVSVNVSAQQLIRSDVASSVARVLEATGLEPGLLDLEITEAMLLRDVDSSANALHDLKRLGVRLVLDDFGTGYSSLSFLKRMTIDALKIDRSFVEPLGEEGEDGTIIGAVLSMANALHIGVTAEGVETGAQLARLRTQGCDSVQGFLFSRPAPAEQIETLIGISQVGSQPRVANPELSSCIA
jgi:diguanylate cyclase (GGDEF)-like protein